MHTSIWIPKSCSMHFSSPKPYKEQLHRSYGTQDNIYTRFSLDLKKTEGENWTCRLDRRNGPDRDVEGRPKRRPTRGGLRARGQGRLGCGAEQAGLGRPRAALR